MTVIENQPSLAGAEIAEATVAIVEPRIQLSAILAGKGDRHSDIQPAIDNELIDIVDEVEDEGDELPVDYDVGPVLPAFVSVPFALLREQVNTAWELFEPAEDDATDEEVLQKKSQHRSAAKSAAIVVALLALACIRCGSDAPSPATLNSMFPPLPGFEGCDATTEWCRAARVEFLVRESQRNDADPRRIAQLINSLMRTWSDLDYAIEGAKSSKPIEAVSEMSLRQAALNIASIISQMQTRLRDASSVAEEVVAARSGNDAEDVNELLPMANDDIHLLPVFKYALKHVVRAGAAIVDTVQEAVAEVTGDMD